MFLLGYDLGSSSVKAALVDADTGRTIGQAQYPDTEMAILAPFPDQAEQHPADWWAAVGQVTRRLLAVTDVPPDQIAGIGIAYQMHGLVLVDAAGEVLRPSIIWCDSRAVGLGEQAFSALGDQYCLDHLLQSPGNFTASKLRWVREHEPPIFQKIHKFLLPGDYIAYRMTGEMTTTITGLSEGICWDFEGHCPADKLLGYYEIPEGLLADRVPVFGPQGKLTAAAAAQLGLASGTPVAYRAGDQPNNALSLNVLRPGDVAATGGTSGVVYAVTDGPRPDPQQRYNSFAHVNYSPEAPWTGALLCINGAGSQYRWLRQLLSGPGLTTPSRLTGNEPGDTRQTSG
ncbi:MAG: FGGY family carbohydrate kinase, partial [Saprospiraceae bacterium]